MWICRDWNVTKIIIIHNVQIWFSYIHSLAFSITWVPIVHNSVFQTGTFICKHQFVTRQCLLRTWPNQRWVLVLYWARERRDALGVILWDKQSENHPPDPSSYLHSCNEGVDQVIICCPVTPSTKFTWNAHVCSVFCGLSSKEVEHFYLRSIVGQFPLVRK